MKVKSLILCSGAFLLLVACVPSVKPFYSAQDVVVDPRLLGVWRAGEENHSGPRTWRFEEASGKAYSLTITEEDGKVGQFKATLFQLERHLFLDIIPTECDFAATQADLIAASVFPGHLLVRVTEIEPELKLGFFDFDYLIKRLEEDPTVLAHHREQDRWLLTADTPELQRFALKHLGGLFQDPDVLRRQPEESPAATATD